MAGGRPPSRAKTLGASRLSGLAKVERGFGISRALARELERQQSPVRDSTLERGLERLRQEWARASARLFALYSDRLSGNVRQQDLLEAAARARAARDAWTRQSGSPVDLRDVERRQVFDVVQIRIEGGSRYLQGPLEEQRRNILELAATRAARLPEAPEKRLAAVAWPAGPDLHATIYFNQREHPTRTPESLAPEQLQAALEARLRDEILRAAADVDRAASVALGTSGPWRCGFRQPIPHESVQRALPR